MATLQTTLVTCIVLLIVPATALSNSFDFFETGGTFYEAVQAWPGVAFSDSGSLQAQLVKASNNKAVHIELSLDDSGYIRVPNQSLFFAVYPLDQQKTTRFNRFKFRFPKGVKGRVWVGSVSQHGQNIPLPPSKDTSGVWKSYTLPYEDAKWHDLDRNTKELLDKHTAMPSIPDAEHVLLFSFEIYDGEELDVDNNSDLHIQVASGTE